MHYSGGTIVAKSGFGEGIPWITRKYSNVKSLMIYFHLFLGQLLSIEKLNGSIDNILPSSLYFYQVDSSYNPEQVCSETVYRQSYREEF